MLDGFSRRCFFESELVARWRRKAGEPSSTSVSGSVSLRKPHMLSGLVPPSGLRRRKEKASEPKRFGSALARCCTVMARSPDGEALKTISGEYGAPKVIVSTVIGKFRSPLAGFRAHTLNPGSPGPR